MSNEITYTLRVDKTEEELELQEFQNQINTAKRNLDKTLREGRRALLGLQRTISGVFRLLKGITKAFGLTLDPLMEAVLQSVMTAVTALMGIAWAHTAIPGYGWLVYAAIVSFTTGFSIAATMDIQRQQAETRQRIDGIMQTLDAVSDIAGLMGGI